MAGSSYPLSSSIAGGLFQNRNYEKNLPGIGTIAGRNFISFPLAICIKKIRKKKSVKCFADFFTAVVGHEIFAAEGPRFNLGAY